MLPERRRPRASDLGAGVRRRSYCVFFTYAFCGTPTHPRSSYKELKPKALSFVVLLVLVVLMMLLLLLVLLLGMPAPLPTGLPLQLISASVLTHAPELLVSAGHALFAKLGPQPSLAARAKGKAARLQVRQRLAPLTLGARLILHNWLKKKVKQHLKQSC